MMKNLWHCLLLAQSFGMAFNPLFADPPCATPPEVRAVAYVGEACALWPIQYIEATEDWLYYAEYRTNNCNDLQVAYLQGHYSWPEFCYPGNPMCEIFDDGEDRMKQNGATRPRRRPFRGLARPASKNHDPVHDPDGCPSAIGRFAVESTSAPIFTEPAMIGGRFRRFVCYEITLKGAIMPDGNERIVRVGKELQRPSGEREVPLVNLQRINEVGGTIEDADTNDSIGFRGMVNGNSFLLLPVK